MDQKVDLEDDDKAVEEVAGRPGKSAQRVAHRGGGGEVFYECVLEPKTKIKPKEWEGVPDHPDNVHSMLPLESDEIDYLKRRYNDENLLKLQMKHQVSITFSSEDTSVKFHGPQVKIDGAHQEIQWTLNSLKKTNVKKAFRVTIITKKGGAQKLVVFPAEIQIEENPEFPHKSITDEFISLMGPKLPHISKKKLVFSKFKIKKMKKLSFEEEARDGQILDEDLWTKIRLDANINEVILLEN